VGSKRIDTRDPTSCFRADHRAAEHAGSTAEIEDVLAILDLSKTKK
jgi:hypothetical protein